MRACLLFLIVSLAASAVRADDVQEAVVKSYELEKAQSYDAAVMTLTAVRKPTYLVNLRLGWLHYLRGDYTTSKSFYQAAMRAAPKAIEPRLGYMLPLMAEARWLEVETIAKTVLSIDSRHYTAALRLSTALRMQGKFRPAREVNAGMLELYPTDLSFLIEQLLVSAALQQNDVATLCAAVLSIDPENVTAKAYASPSTARRN
ncbi:MAG: hypothetical protein JNL96_28085 [Planctomycetaceae bacterium]|nr:hypothetical protein [Planctomycetaceae bacterium]